LPCVQHRPEGGAESQARTPAAKLYEAGIKLTASSDDPPHFHTSLGQAMWTSWSSCSGGDETPDARHAHAQRAGGGLFDEATRQKLVAKLDARLQAPDPLGMNKGPQT
jgi:adenosine deaminase